MQNFRDIPERLFGIIMIKQDMVACFPRKGFYDGALYPNISNSKEYNFFTILIVSES